MILIEDITKSCTLDIWDLYNSRLQHVLFYILADFETILKVVIDLNIISVDLFI